MFFTSLSTWFARPRAGPKGAGQPRPARYDAPLQRRPERPCGLEVGAVQTAYGLFARVKGVAGIDQSGALLSGLLSATARRRSLVILDLSGLSFISSLAIGVLTAYRRGVVRGGGHVVLAGDLQPAVREALERAGLRSLFGIILRGLANSPV